MIRRARSRRAARSSPLAGASRGWTGASALAALCALAGFAGAPARAERVEATLYHYNIQYVAGGMLGFPDGRGSLSGYQLTEAEVEDAIVRESFAPLLEIYERHPAWKADLEMQGLFVEVLAARHPDVLARLRALANRGQIELVSIHYSDQLFLAYPRRDLERSLLRTRDVFRTHGLPLSSVAFAQEGQFGEGMLAFLGDHGFRVAVLPKNLLSYMLGYEPDALFYRAPGMDVVVGGRSGAHGDLAISWSGPADGETILTGSTNPYLGPSFRAQPQDLYAFEAERAAREAAGTRFVTVSELVALARDRAPAVELPPLTDGTWQPRSTRNLFLWMGGLGGLFDIAVPTENDNAVLTANVRASLAVRACEVVASAARALPGAADRSRALDEAARALMLAQVSDSTGWNPWLGEVNYALTHARIAFERARSCVDHPALRGPARRRVYLGPGLVLDDPPPDPEPPPADAPFAVEATAPGRGVSLRWRRIAADRRALWADFTPSSTAERAISLLFPMAFDRIVYVPALDEGRVVDLPASAFGATEHTLPLPSGLVGLGPGVFLVKSTRHVHLAALVRPGDRQIELRDETARADEPQHWRFEVVEGDAGRALQVAFEINLAPPLDFELEPPRPRGCTAVSGGEGAFGVAALLAAAALVRRRRTKVSGQARPRSLSPPWTSLARAMAAISRSRSPSGRWRRRYGRSPW
jgi:uncharacterized protein (TIGR03382 family)